MKHVLLLITTVIAMAISAIAPAFAQQSRTLKSEMEVIHESLGVNFVYDSAIEINVPYSGKPMKDIIKGNKKEHSVLLEECLVTLFAGTNIEYEVMKKYVVLTQADKRKKPKDYTIFIEEQNDSIPEAIITALVKIPVNSTQTGMERIDGSKLNRGFAFLSSPDVIKTLQILPGVSSGTELLSGLYVHGGTGSDNLYLMDGVPLYSVGHLAGVFSSFNSDVIDNVDFYKSGFPARYGGRMSSVVDVTTRDGDFNDYSGTFSIGLIEGRFQMEGPIVKGKTSFNFGLRRSWLDVLTIPGFAIYNALRDSENSDHTVMRYAMTDLNGKITHKFSDDNTLSFSVFAGQDALKSKSVSDPTDWDTAGNESNMELGLRWGNILASLRWKYNISDNLRSDVNLYHVQSRANVGLLNSWKRTDESVSYEETDDDINRSNVYDSGIKADFLWHPTDNQHVRFGAEAIWHVFSPQRISERIYRNSDTAPIDTKKIEGFTYHGLEPSLYIEDEISLTDWMTANVGLRYVMFLTDGKAYNRLEPRAALRFRIGEIASIKMSYSDMNQFSHRVNASSPLEVPTGFWMPSTSTVAPMHSRQYSLGSYFNLPHNIKLDIEGYYKTMDNIREYMGISSLYPPLDKWEEDYTNGLGRSYGVETHMEWSSEKTWISLGYTLSWSERYFPEMHDEWYSDMFDNRHKINLSATQKLGKKTEMYAGWTFHSGNRMTLPDQVIAKPDGYGGYDYSAIYSSPNNAILPAYHRLDVGFNFHKTTRRGNEAIWNLSVYNAYCHMNAINAYVTFKYDQEHHGSDPLSSYSEMQGWIPIIPTFSYTLKF